MNLKQKNMVVGFVQVCNKNGGGGVNTGPASRYPRHEPSVPRANLIPFPDATCTLLTDHDSKMGYLVSMLTVTAECFRVYMV
jgi:hypothetical protein